MRNWQHRKLAKASKTANLADNERKRFSASLVRLNRSGLYRPENEKNALVVTRLTQEEIAASAEAHAAKEKREKMISRQEAAIATRIAINHDQPIKQMRKFSARAAYAELSAQRKIIS